MDELNSGEEYYVLGATYGDTPALRPYFHNHHIRRSKKRIKVKMLANYETRSNLELTTKKYAKIRYLPQHFISNMTIFVYNNKSIIAIWTKSPTAFLMEGEEVVKNFKTYFDTFWKIAKK